MGAGADVPLAPWRHGRASRGGFAAVDVGYPEPGGARAAVVLANGADFAEIAAERTVWVPEVAAYRPGRFFLRELPPLRAVLAGSGALDMVIIDGYVDLDPAGRPGLGAPCMTSSGPGHRRGQDLLPHGATQARPGPPGPRGRAL
jgi:hypothetical protein